MSSAPALARPSLSPRRGYRDAHRPKWTFISFRERHSRVLPPDNTDFGKRPFSPHPSCCPDGKSAANVGLLPQLWGQIPVFSAGRVGQFTGPRGVWIFRGMGIPYLFFCPGNRSWGCRFSATTTGPNPPLAGLTTSWDGGPHPVFHPDNENTTDTELLAQP